MEGAMDLMTTLVYEKMTPLDKMYMLSTDQVLDLATLAVIYGRGYTRVPVFEGENREHVSDDKCMRS
jgi:metal transporter CNNM